MRRLATSTIRTRSTCIDLTYPFFEHISYYFKCPREYFILSYINMPTANFNPFFSEPCSRIWSKAVYTFILVQNLIPVGLTRNMWDLNRFRILKALRGAEKHFLWGNWNKESRFTSRMMEKLLSDENKTGRDLVLILPVFRHFFQKRLSPEE